MKFKQRYRLGLDIGTNSIGWCVLRLNEQDEPIGIIRAGSRIFSDGRHPKTLASLAADRRKARQMRRRHDRVLKRMARFMQGLIRFGLMPVDDGERLKLSAMDPYKLRRRGLDQPLTAFELGRALYHLAKRRGFKSSRKSKGEDENESGKIATAIHRTREAIHEAGCRTFGEYLAMRHDRRDTVRARKTAENDYILYTQRAMVADEFDALWATQAPHHPEIMTEEARAWLRDTLLFQRNLLPVMPGSCIFEIDEYREPLWSPLQQRFRVLQELNNLRVVEGMTDRSLSLQERNVLRDALYRSRERSFAQIRKLLDLPRTTRFNLESDKRKGLKGDIVASQLGAEDALGQAWFAMPFQAQRDLAEMIDRIDDTEALKQRLMEAPWSLGETVAEHVARKVRLPEDYGSLSRKALERIVPILDSDVITYDKAALKAGYKHSDFYTGEIFPRLPYYGELLRSYTSPTPKAKDASERKYGRLANPTVHIGLNQLRQLVNEIIRRWGQPTEIIVELAREFGLSGQKRRDLESEQKANQDLNEKLNAELHRLGQRENRANRERLKLWNELGKEDAMDRHCVYSGQRLSKAQLFSGEVEVDHILPFSRSLDDSLSNKVLCITRANRDKKNSTPFEGFGHSPAGYSWSEIEERASRLPRNKAKRFKESALEDFLGEKDFLDRHLTDTAYLSRVARQYLTAVCPPNKVWVATGRLTAMLRQKYGLNEILDPEHKGKNRDDHRHHAVDAAVVAICNRSLIQKVSTAARNAEDLGEHRLLKSLDVPWVGFREELEQVIHRIIVSHKPDHGREAGLHNDTNYGKRGEPDKKGAMLVSVRKPVSSLTQKNVSSIADPLLRDELTALLDGLSGKELKACLDEYSQRTGIRSVRMEERLSVIPIEDRMTRKPYRYVKGDGNYCYDIYRDESGRWGGDVVSTYDANQSDFNPNARIASNGKPLVMRLRKGDFLKMDLDGREKVMRIARFSEGMIALAEHQEANVDARTRDKDSGLKYVFKAPSALKPVAARLVGVNILGYVNDPGFKD